MSATRAELIAEMVSISTWQHVYGTNEGSDRIREIEEELKGND